MTHLSSVPTRPLRVGISFNGIKCLERIEITAAPWRAPPRHWFAISNYLNQVFAINEDRKLGLVGDFEEDIYRARKYVRKVNSSN